MSEILLEELGHFLDVKLETEDALGDEGAIFASVATGEELDETQLQALQKESDRTAISLNGETITLEQNSNGTGLLATYYDNPDFSNPVASRVDPSIAFLWGLGSPHSAVESDRFSVKWRGQIEPRYGETYTFTTRSDDGVRLKINGQLIIDDWNSGPERVNQGTIVLAAGQKYDIELDYYEETAEAKLELLWESTNQPQEIVPSSQLYPGEIALPLGVEGTGTGLQGTYYDNSHFSEPVLSRTDEQIDFEWGDNAPDEALEADTFSARWIGKIEALYDEEYTFITQSDDGVRLKVNGEVLIDDWTSRPKRENQGKIILEAGKEYDIELDYYEDALHAEVKLLWQSQHQTREVIPRRFLHPGQPPLPDNIEGDGTGLKGEYFNNKDFTDLALERTDSEIDFEWGDNAPDAALEADTYSVRWTGQIEALYDEEYTFYTQSDDGVRLWIDGQPIIDDWTARPERENQGKIVLEGGKKYDIKLEYFEEGLTAISKLLWSSSSQTKEVIPASQLISENPDCAPITVGWSNVLDIVEPGAYTFDINLPFGTAFTVNGERFNTTPEDNSFSLLLPAGAIDFQLQMPAISPCDPPWSDTEENDGSPPIDIGITLPDGRRQIGRIAGGWLTNEGPDSGTGGDDGGWWNIDWPPLEPVDPGTNEPPPASEDEPPGTGLYAQYFKGTTFSNLAYAKFVDNVYEDWDYKGPLWDDSWLSDEVRLNVEGDNFGIRYTGQIKAPDDGEYKFSFKDLDGKARLWINGELVMDGEWHGTPLDANDNGIADDVYYGDVSESISLKAGQKYNFQLDFVDPGGEASALLHWEKDGGEPATIWNSLLYPTMPPGMLLVNDEPTPVLVGKSAAAASLLSQYFYEDYESVRVTVRDRSPDESAAFLNSPSGDVLWSGTLSKNEVLGTSSYLLEFRLNGEKSREG